MKSYYKKGILAVAIFSLTLGIPKISIAASSKKDSDANYDLMYRRDAVQEKKSWKIKFSKELDEHTVKNDNILIEDEDGKKVYADVSLDKDDKEKKTIIVRNVSRYVQGKKYHIIVKDNIKSKKGKRMRKPVKVYFNIKNAYAGLPCENGLIVVRDTAYSIDYLAQNSRLKNELINDSYDIYYCYSPTEQKIKNIFGNIDLNKNEITKHYDKMTYITESGRKCKYEWSYKEGEYELVEPAVDAEVTVNSSAKVIMVKVKDVEGVDGAVYYKLKHNNQVKRIGESSVFTSHDFTEKISILNYNKNVIATGNLNTQFSNEKKTNIKLVDDDNVGNTAGNINNNGYATENSEGELIYNNTGDKNSLYKMDTNGMFNNAISYDDAQYINLIDDWVYYSNYSDKGKLYKIKLDGTGRQKICDDMAAYVTISGDLIYYSNHSDGGKLYKIRPDGSGRKRVSVALDHEVAYINVSGHWIYYTDINDRHKPYVINTDGSYVAKISDEWANSIQVVGDWVYYTSSTGVLSKVKKDGTGSIIAIKGQTREFDKGFHLNVVNGWIYYSNYLDGGKLYKIRTDGSGDKLKLTNETVGYINIAGNYIYYVSNKKLYKLPIDADGKIKGEAITKASGDNKIKQMDDLKVTVPYYDVNMTLTEIENKYLPEKVPGIQDDNTMHQYSVEWNRDKVSIRNGIRTYTGEVIGFNRKVKLELEIPSEMLNETNTITVYNNPDRSNDVVEVENLYDNNLHANPPKLNAGDVLNAYDTEECLRSLSKATVVRSGRYNKAVLKRLELDKVGQKSLWITVTRKGKSESRPTEVKQSDMPVILETRDNDNVGYGLDGRDVSITDWMPSLKARLSAYYIYLLPNRRRLDLSDISKIKALKGYGEAEETQTLYGVNSNLNDLVTSSNKGRVWTGERKMKLDSSSTKLRQGKYDIFISGKYESTASSDNRGKCPSVISYISSDPSTVDMRDESLPNRPTVANQRVKGNTELTLPTALKEGETAWLVPTTTLDKITTLKREDGFNESQFDLSNAGNANGLKPTHVEYSKISNVIVAPEGMKNTNKDYTDIEFKLVYVNSVGASIKSSYSVIVDNRPPKVEIEKQYESVRTGEKVKAQSNEDGELYLVPKDNGTDTKEQLEGAIKNGTGRFTKARGKVNYSLDTTTLDGIIYSESKKEPVESPRTNYKVVAVDEAGNISDGKLITVSITVEKLGQLIAEVKEDIGKPDIDSDVKAKLSEAYKEAEKVYNRVIEPSSGETFITQNEINRTFDDLKYVMMDNGVSSKYGNIDDILRAELNDLQNMNITKEKLLQTKSRFIKDDGNQSVSIEWVLSNNDYIEMLLNTDTETKETYGQKIHIKQRPVVKDKDIKLMASVTVKKNGAIRVSNKSITITVKHIDMEGKISIGVEPTLTPEGKVTVTVKFDKFADATDIGKYHIAVSESGKPTVKNIVASSIETDGTIKFNYDKDKYICVGIVIEDTKGNKKMSDKFDDISTKPAVVPPAPKVP